MKNSEQSSPFEKAGFYFLGILAVTITGFLIPFMSTWSDPAISHPPVIHLHAGFMSLWMAIMIAQPFLIQLKWKKAHKIIGNSTYFIFPILCIGIIDLTLTSLPGLDASFTPTFLAIQLMDFVILTGCFSLGMYYRKEPTLHARFIIGSAIPIAEPGLTRSLIAILPVEDMVARGISFGILLLILLTLVIKDWPNQKIRWVFTSIFIVTLLFSFLVLFGHEWTLWQSIVDWMVMA